jgi:hypothetical protein
MLSNFMDLIYDLLHYSIDYEVAAIFSLVQELSIGLYHYCLPFPKYLRGLCIIDCMNILTEIIF